MSRSCASRSGRTEAGRGRRLGDAVGGAYWITGHVSMTTVAADSPLIRPHPLDHPLDMGDRGFRLDAVAEVEDQPALAVIRQHVIDRLVERVAAGDQGQRIEIAL